MFQIVSCHWSFLLLGQYHHNMCNMIILYNDPHNFPGGPLPLLLNSLGQPVCSILCRYTPITQITLITQKTQITQITQITQNKPITQITQIIQNTQILQITQITQNKQITQITQISLSTCRQAGATLGLMEYSSVMLRWRGGEDNSGGK